MEAEADANGEAEFIVEAEFPGTDTGAFSSSFADTSVCLTDFVLLLLLFFTFFFGVFNTSAS